MWGADETSAIQVMLLELDSHSGVPLYRQMVDQIRRQVLTGRLGAGEQLPSVRELAGQLKVYPMTVSKSYSLLVMEQVLERRRGVGFLVGGIRTAAKSSDCGGAIGDGRRRGAGKTFETLPTI